jgi:phage tail protein, P2 protein I family
MSAPAALAPPNAVPLVKAADQLQHDRIDAIPAPLRTVWSARDCPEELLPWLAWALSVDQWSADWPVEVRRARVAAAIAIQRIKGTAKSVTDVISSFGGNVVMRAWFEREPAGIPHTFNMTVSLGGQSEGAPSAEFIDAVIAEVGRTKSARDHFDFTVAVNGIGQIGLRAVARPVTFARIFAQAPAA